MINYEQRERFWKSKAAELIEKLNQLSENPSYQTENQKKNFKKEAKFEELRLINDLSQEEIDELRISLSTEKTKLSQATKIINDYKGKVLELERANKSLTNMLIEKKCESAASGRLKDSEEVEKLRKELNGCLVKIKEIETEKREIKDSYDFQIKELKMELLENQKTNTNLQKSFEKFKTDSEKTSENNDKNYKDYIEKILTEKNNAKDELEILKKQQKDSISLITEDLSEKLKDLEEENLNLKEQIEIYQEDQTKKLKESSLLQQLSYRILSKDKSNIDSETLNLFKQTLGENPTKLIESFQEKACGFEQENKVLTQRVSQELNNKIDNLEKIKNLQETLAKLTGDPGLENEINKTKVHIIAARSALTSAFTPRGSDNKRDNLFAKDEEIEFLRSENYFLKSERDKIKEECALHSNTIKGLEIKLSSNETQPSFADLVCFLQCEAAALEDMLVEGESNELDSEDLY